MSVLTVALVAVVAYLTLVPAVRALRGRRRFGVPDRTGAVGEVTTALFATVLAHRLVPWQTIPEWLWALPVAATTATVLGVAAIWRDLPTLAAARRRRHVVEAVAGAVLCAALVVVVAVG